MENDVFTITWTDDNPDTYKISARYYNLAVLDAERLSDTETRVTLKGARPDAEWFKEDFYEYAEMQPMSSWREMDDDEYEARLAEELAKCA